MKPNRRQFLIGTATTVAGLSLKLSLPEIVLAQESEEKLKKYRRKMFGYDVFGFHRPGLVDYLSPELYQKDPNKFKEILLQIKQHFYQKSEIYEEFKAFEQREKDANTINQQLLLNLSLEGGSLLDSMKTSESVRQLLKNAGFFRFEEKVKEYFLFHDVLQKRMGHLKTLLPVAVRENKKNLTQNIEDCQNALVYFTQEASLTQDAMFLLRWHYPKYLTGKKIDFQESHRKYQETLEEIEKLYVGLVKMEHITALSHLVNYQKKYKEANNSFQKDIGILLQQAETKIAENILGQPLAKIEYKNKLFYATKEFSKDWNKVKIIIKNKK